MKNTLKIDEYFKRPQRIDRRSDFALYFVKIKIY